MANVHAALNVLHLVLSIGETSAPYNEHCLPWANQSAIAICTYFRATVQPPNTITLFEGDGSVKGFFRVLQAALAAKEYDVIHVHAPHLGFLLGLATTFAVQKHTPATLITIHDSYPNYKLRNRLLLLPVFATFPKIVCCSNASFASFPWYYRLLAGKRLGAIQNGLDIDRVDRVAAQARPATRTAEQFTLVAISRLVAIKNPFTVLKAFQSSAVPTSRLVYIGDGVLRPDLLAQNQTAPTEQQVTFTGLIPREQVFAHLLNADLFISASHGEGLPISVLEAMACGCPVLLSDIPPHREIAQHGNFIPLVQQDDVTGFAREISKFQAMSAAERTQIGQRCRKLVEEHFSLPAMRNNYLDLYHSLLQQPRPTLAEAR